MNDDSDDSNDFGRPYADELRYPLFAWYLESLMDEYERGPWPALLRIGQCMGWFVEHYPEARSLLQDFDEALESFISGDVKTLDEAFGVVGYHAGRGPSHKAYRFRYKNASDIFFKVEALCHPENPNDKIDQKHAFEIVARDYPDSSESKIRDIYQAVKRQFKKYLSAKAIRAEEKLRARIAEQETKK